MDHAVGRKAQGFVERRSSRRGTRQDGPERRQFRDGQIATRPEVQELAAAVDQYKMSHHRRFITFDELYDVIAGLGYHK